MKGIVSLMIFLCLASVKLSAREENPPQTNPPQDSINLSTKNERPKLRPLSPDRPHQTESPHTVDAGHIQVESDWVNYRKEVQKNDSSSQQVELLAFNLKIGFHKRMDLEIFSSAYSTKKMSPGDFTQNEYLPYLTMRYKVNIADNDSGDLPMAIMPLINTTNFFKEKFIVKSAGILFLAEKELNEKYGLGYTGGLSEISVDPWFKEVEFFSTVSFDHPLVSSLRHFVELSYRHNKVADYPDLYSFDTGVTFTPYSNFQLDAGAYFFFPKKFQYFFVGGTIKI